MEADSQYVDVEPSYKYTPTTVPAAEVPDPVPGSTQNQSSTQVTPTAPSYGIIQIPIRMYQRRHLYLNRCRM